MGAVPLPSAGQERVWWSQDDVGKAGLGAGAGQKLLQPRKPSVNVLVAGVTQQLQGSWAMGLCQWTGDVGLSAPVLDLSSLPAVTEALLNPFRPEGH